MDTSRRHPRSSLTEELYREPYRYQIFQAVRLLERIAREQASEGTGPVRAPVGRDARPRQEAVRFRALPGLSFPAAAIDSLEESAAKEANPREAPPPEMRVSFMGLTGPTGVLPEHYTELLMQRARLKDFTLQNFLDLFNHRTVSLFYRAWEKYRFPVSWERAQLEGGDDDLVTQCLLSLLGLGTARLREALPVSGNVLLYYAGHFAHRPRAAIALESLLADYLQLTVRVREFQGHWLYLPDHAQTRLPDDARPPGQYHELGVDAVLGDRVWDVRSKFRVCVGPLDYGAFLRLMPGGDLLASVSGLVRAYVGPELSFDLQLILRHEDIPTCRLVETEEYSPRLGINTWLGGAPTPARDAVDAIMEELGV